MESLEETSMNRHFIRNIGNKRFPFKLPLRGLTPHGKIKKVEGRKEPKLLL